MDYKRRHVTQSMISTIVQYIDSTCNTTIVYLFLRKENLQNKQGHRKVLLKTGNMKPRDGMSSHGNT